LFVMGVVIAVAVIAFFALILMFLTHNFYPTKCMRSSHILLWDWLPSTS
jgi:hypothetical protein